MIYSYTSNHALVTLRAHTKEWLLDFVANQKNSTSLTMLLSSNEIGKDQHSRTVLSRMSQLPQSMSTCAASRAGTCCLAYSRSNPYIHSHKPHAKDIRETGGTWSLIWSIGRIPEQIISALVETKDGITRPGQSQRHRPGSTYRVYMINNPLVHYDKSASMEEKGTTTTKHIDGTWVQMTIHRNSTNTDTCPTGPNQLIKKIWCRK